MFERVDLSRRMFLKNLGEMAVGTTMAIMSSTEIGRNNMIPIEVGRYYPELSPATITGSGNIKTANNNRYRWLNVSPLIFNEENARQLFNYYENIARTGNISFGFDYQGQQRVDFTVHPFPGNQEAVIFIVGAASPLPSWAPGDYQGVTDLRPSNTRNISVIRTLPLSTLSAEDQLVLRNYAGFATRTFAAEAGNLSFVVRDRFGRHDRLGQETFINSMSRFVAARIKGTSYEDYVRSVEGYGTFVPNLEPIPFLTFPARDYQLVKLPQALFRD